MTARELVINTEPTSSEAMWVERIVETHQRRVMMTAYRLLGRMEDARDAAQQVFLRVHKHRKRLLRTGDPAALLYRMTVNACADIARKRRELPIDPDWEVPASEPGADHRLERDAERERLHRALQRLPERQRAAIVLRDIEGLPGREVAGILECSEVTVRTLISAARLRLREWMRETR